MASFELLGSDEIRKLLQGTEDGEGGEVSSEEDGGEGGDGGEGRAAAGVRASRARASSLVASAKAARVREGPVAGAVGFQWAAPPGRAKRRPNFPKQTIKSVGGWQAPLGSGAPGGGAGMGHGVKRGGLPYEGSGLMVSSALVNPPGGLGLSPNDGWVGDDLPHPSFAARQGMQLSPPDPGFAYPAAAGGFPGPPGPPGFPGHAPMPPQPNLMGRPQPGMHAPQGMMGGPPMGGEWPPGGPGAPWGGAGQPSPSLPMDPAIMSHGAPPPSAQAGFIDPAIVGFRPEAAEPAPGGDGGALPPMLQQLFKSVPSGGGGSGAGDSSGGLAKGSSTARVQELEEEVACLRQELESERAARKEDRMKMASMVSEVKAKWTQDKETIAMLQRELAARQNVGGSEPRSQSLLERLNITPPQQPRGQMPGGGLGVGGLPNYSGGGAAPNQLG